MRCRRRWRRSRRGGYGRPGRTSCPTSSPRSGGRSRSQSESSEAAAREATMATAVAAWDRRWASAEGRADWIEPEADVVALPPVLKERGARRVLDLGCGVGRHALFFAEHGFAVSAIDGSATGIAVAGETARARGLALDLPRAMPTPCRSPTAP